MKKPAPRNLKSSDGQTMVEFALVLPLLAMLLFGVIQFGIVFNNYLDLTDATRAGARKAAVSRNTSDPSGPAGVATQAVINSAGDITLTSSNVTVQTTGSDGVNVGARRRRNSHRVLTPTRSICSGSSSPRAT